jgi:solute carrier family 26 (sodium-independent sulfate anion transporter), member 11
MATLKKFVNRKLGRSSKPEDNGRLDQSDIYPGYVEEDPTVTQWLRGIAPSGRQVIDYLSGLFPFSGWIFSYNLQWFLGDLIAGVTVGLVVIPQGMAYAKLAGLPVQFGLYTSFMGALVYW